MNRRTFGRTFVSGSVALLLPSSLAAQDVTAWTSGGDDPSGYTHDEALIALIQAGLLPQESFSEFSLLANANGGAGRGYSTDPIEEGLLFEGMTFGGKKPGSRRRLLRKVAAKPSVWNADASRQMQTWTWEGNVDGQRVTVGYTKPVVCGNSSAIRYRQGAPVCVPIPKNALRV